MMDCDTTGVEQDIALVKYKLLAGRGLLKIVNQTVALDLKRLITPLNKPRRSSNILTKTIPLKGAPANF